MKDWYIKSSFSYGKNDIAEPGGPGGIARFKADLGGTVSKIKALGCTGVIIGFNDIVPLKPEDFEFIECLEAADMELSVSVWHFPPSFAATLSFWDYSWHQQRAISINGFIDNINTRFNRRVKHIGDCEFYAANHPYRNDKDGNVVKDLPWTPFVADSFGRQLPINVYDEVWPMGKQHADSVAYQMHVLAPACIDWDKRYDESGGAFKDPELTQPANPPPNTYPAWWDSAKPKRHAYFCNANGTHVKAGSIYRKLWKPTDFTDGVTYVDDRDQTSVLA